MIRTALVLALCCSLAVHAEPPAVRVETRPLTLGGAAVTAVGWLSSIYGFFHGLDCSERGGLGLRVCHGSSPWVMVPVLGPWAALLAGDVPPVDVLQAVALGVVQAVGVVLLLTGVVIRAAGVEVTASGVRF
jgi:hypothetical protein